MQNYQFTSEQVRLIKEALNHYCETQAFNQYSEDKLLEASRIYSKLGKIQFVHDYPICDY